VRYSVIRQKLRAVKRAFKRNGPRRNLFSAGALLLLLVVLVGMMQYKAPIPQTAYSPLLDMIATAESRGNYNAHFGNAANQTVRFTDMTIADVLQWQNDFVQAGNPSSAVGRYQFIQPTLQGLVSELQLNPNDRFDETTQNKLAIALLERRGSIDFIDGKVSETDFAHNLSKEWAALPKVIGNAPEASYYDGDGLNKSLVDSKTSLAAVEQFKQLATNN
jgi:conjugal transfer mating pair stabilization protein TraG